MMIQYWFKTQFITWVIIKIVSSPLGISQCANNDKGDAGGHLPLDDPAPHTL